MNPGDICLSTSIHSYPQEFTKKKVAKKKERQLHGGYFFYLTP